MLPLSWALSAERGMGYPYYLLLRPPPKKGVPSIRYWTGEAPVLEIWKVFSTFLLSLLLGSNLWHKSVLTDPVIWFSHEGATCIALASNNLAQCIPLQVFNWFSFSLTSFHYRVKESGCPVINTNIEGEWLDSYFLQSIRSAGSYSIRVYAKKTFKKQQHKYVNRNIKWMRFSHHLA